VKCERELSLTRRKFSTLVDHITAFLYKQRLTEAQVKELIKERERIFEILAQDLRMDLNKVYQELDEAMTSFRDTLRELYRLSDDLDLLNFHREEIQSFCRLDRELSDYICNQDALVDEIESLKLAKKRR